MKKLLTSGIMTVLMSCSMLTEANVAWQPYSEAAVVDAQKEGKAVVLGFHKKGCGTCNSQDHSMEKAGINELKNVVLLKVERKDSKMDSVYSKYGLTKRQWASMVLLKDSKEIARIQPGDTSSENIASFVAKAK